MIFSFPFLFKVLGLHHIEAISLWPLIVLRHHALEQQKVIINHERIHLKQQLELLVIPFYILYIMEYIYYRLKAYSHDQAYRNISFEREAYRYEADLNYIKRRKRFASFRFG